MDAIKRYSLYANTEAVFEDPDSLGAWVKYEDHLAALKAAAEQEPMAYVDVIDGGSVFEMEQLEGFRNLPVGRYALYTHPIASEDKWKEAIWHECMLTEAVAPNEDDPIGTIKALVSYHVQLAASEDSERQEPVAHAWYHRGEVNFDAEPILSMLDDGKGTPIHLFAKPLGEQVAQDRLDWIMEHGLPFSRLADDYTYNVNTPIGEGFKTKLEAIDAARREGK